MLKVFFILVKLIFKSLLMFIAVIGRILIILFWDASILRLPLKHFIVIFLQASSGRNDFDVLLRDAGTVGMLSFVS